MLRLLVVVSFLCWWLAMPPLKFMPLIVVAPVCWTVLVRQLTISRAVYFDLWFCGVMFWLVNTYWVGYPHPATILGLFALSIYLACYLPLAIFLARRAVHLYQFPCFIALPMVWCGSEFVRYRLFGGFSFVALEHALAPMPILIQTADIAGTYLVGMIIVLFGCGIGSLIPLAVANDAPQRHWFFRRQLRIPKNYSITPFIISIAVIILALVYGAIRQQHYDVARSDQAIRTVKIAAIQGNKHCLLNPPAGFYDAVFADMTEQAKLAAMAGAELIVMPETVCTLPLVTFTPHFVPKDWHGKSVHEITEQQHQFSAKTLDELRAWGAKIGVPVLVGISTYLFSEDVGDEPLRYNSAILINPKNRFLQQYDKRHLIMFGEYIPLAAWIPEFLCLPLCSLCPTAAPGNQWVVMECGPLRIAPNICYESTFPHVIRRQVRDLYERKQSPSILINISNDGWFIGSVEQDFHLITQIFRAVEQRKEYITSTNGGFSAHIDATGRIKSCGERNQSEVVMAQVPTQNPLQSIYTEWGDTLAMACVFASAFLAAPRRWVRGKKI